MGYDNSSRQARAQQTRSRVLAAASASFLQTGYAATTIRAVAEEAGVSQETVYKTFASKAGLLKAVYDVTIAGDEQPIPMARRPEFLALQTARDEQAAASAYGVLAGHLAERTGPLLRVLFASRSGDADLDTFAATIDGERLAGAAMAVGHWDSQGWLRPDLTAERARDLLWTLNSPAVFLLLDERGWSLAEYQTWLGATLLATVLR